MKNSILFILLLLATSCMSQSLESISLKIINGITREPIPFVNVVVPEKQLGSITDESGTFNLLFVSGKILPEDMIKISSIGYETKNLRFDTLSDYLKNKKVVLMKPVTYQLGEVLIKSPPRERKFIGHSAFTASGMGYWEGEDAIGGEIASVISVKKENTKLLNVTFKLLENRADSLRLKLKIYEFDGGDPEKNILERDIYHTITKKKGWETINLQSHNILTSGDIIIGLELVEIYGDSHYFSVALSAYGGMSFIREPYQRYWSIRRKSCIGFKVESSYPLKMNPATEELSDSNR